MILNSYAILLAFVAVLRLALVGCGLAVGVAAARSRPAPGEDDARTPLLFLLAVVLVALNLVSWPLLYLLLQSYVPHWSGVMCVYGVTQIGAGAQGPARHLPGLLAFLQAAKPLLVFAGGGWLVLYALNRRAAAAPLAGRLLVLLVPLGGLAAADAVAELAYVTIPKVDELPPGGCCTVTAGRDRDALPLRGVLDRAGRPAVARACYALNGLVILGLVALTRSPRLVPRLLGPLVVLGCGAAVATGLWAVDVLAPAVLGLPDHRCPYDLLPVAPDAVLAAAIYTGGVFALGWAGVARWLGRAPGTAADLPPVTHGLLVLSLQGFAAGLLMLMLEAVLA